MTISAWIQVGGTMIIVLNTWLLLFINLPATHQMKTRFFTFVKSLLKARWQYLSMAFIITLILALIFELTKSSQLTRWSVLFISLLVTSIIIQLLLFYIISLKQKLQQQISNIETLTIMNF